VTMRLQIGRIGRDDLGPSYTGVSACHGRRFMVRLRHLVQLERRSVDVFQLAAIWLSGGTERRMKTR
jgi:hypothetical protein